MNRAFQIIRRRYALDECEPQFAALFIAPAFFKGNSSSSQPTTTATGAGQVASGTASQTVGSGSIGVSQGKYLEQGATDLSKSNIQANSDTTNNVKDSGNTVTKTLLGGSDISGNSGTVNITDNGAVQTAANLAGMALTDQSTGFAQALQELSNLADSTSTTTNALAAQQSADLAKLLDSVNQANTSAHDSLTNLTGGVLGSINQDLQTAAAGTTAIFQKTLLWVGLGLVAVLGLGFFMQRKHG